MATKTKKKAKKLKSKKSKAKKPAPKKTAAKKTARPKKTVPKKKKPVKKTKSRGKSDNSETVVFEPKGLGARSGGQSGDLQGLSNREGADSESVDELLEEGNAFEAEVIKGIEDVPDADEGEIRTHEVPEDDVPEEYLEKDE
jgi:RNA polymerase primary sigma factor